MAELGAANYAKRVTPGKNLISQREAYREFGEARIKDWARRGLITDNVRNNSGKNSKILHSMAELLAIEKSEKLNFIIKSKRIK